MLIYEVGPMRLPVRGWARAQRLAYTEAVARDAAIDIWKVTHHGTVRMLRLTVFPNGAVARPEALHRLPQGFGL